ncbi:MAG: hypothetical protein AAF468_21855 [Pseudomonadota bacterium]
MITYNVGHSFFHHKGDAETYRKALKLPPKATRKIRVRNSEELSQLLHAICNKDQEAPMGLGEAAMIARTKNDIPGCVPKFLREGWGYRS